MTSLAIVTQGYFTAGGVQAVARWLKSVGESDGYNVIVFDLATSRSDRLSRRAIDPPTWLKGPPLVAAPNETGVFQVGAPLAELEPCRYLPRRDLTARLAGFDVVQVVAGAACLATSALTARVPVVIQPATILSWEREAKKTSRVSPASIWASAMTMFSLPLERFALRRADAVLVHNTTIMSELRSMRIPATLAPTGVDTSTFIPPVSGWSAKGPIVCVGRLNEPRKALDVILDAHAYLKNRGETRNLILAGRGELPEGIRRRIESSELRHWIDVRQDLTQDDLIGLLQSAAVFVQASREEGLGIALIEAMACGVPTVATRTAGTTMTVDHGVSGFLVEQGDADYMARRMQTVLNESGRNMSLSARNRAVTNFSTEAAAQPFLDAWASLASR